MLQFSLMLTAAMQFFSTAYAQNKKPLTPQQQRLAECSVKAKGLKGDEYRKARNECLKGGAVTVKQRTPQQQKLAQCNARAKGLKGAEFKRMRDSCLRN